MLRRNLIGMAALSLIAASCSIDLSGGAGTAALPVDPNEPVAGVVRKVLPAVVNVTTDVFRPGVTQTSQGVGTGFVVGSDGVIVTNCHVVEGASKITVFTSEEKPAKYEARVIGGDCLHDLAVLQIDAKGLPTVTIGESSSLQLGQRVVALGYALALEGGPSVTTGIVSSLDRTVRARDPQCDVCENGVRIYEDVVQTDAAINQGNSGGPLVDMRGRVVGINSAGADDAENIGFAIAIDSVRRAIEAAINDPLAPTAYLGVSTQDVTPELAVQLGLNTETGAYVVAVLTDGPASGAGLEAGSVIVAVAGREVTSSDSLSEVLASLAPGESVTVDVVEQSGEARALDVELGTRPLPVNLP